MEYNYKTISDMLGLSPNGAYNKIKGKTNYTMPELIIMKREFGLTYDDLFKMIEINTPKK